MTDDKSCSCYVKVTGAICEGHTYTHEIVYCPLHDAAPELLEALKKAKWNLSLCKQFTMVKELRKIIARAEGKEVNDG